MDVQSPENIHAFTLLHHSDGAATALFVERELAAAASGREQP